MFTKPILARKFFNFKLSWVLCISIGSLSFSHASLSETATHATDCAIQQHFVFSWAAQNSCLNSESEAGNRRISAPVHELESDHPGWYKLTHSGITQFQKDRLAILAMAGGYKVSFEFLEVLGLEKEFNRDDPSQSWTTEYIYIVANEPEFISLQHVMVMRFQLENGAISEPVVTKRWRQDWHYQPKTMWVYDHDLNWKTVHLDRHERDGLWMQSVYDVDDSPRFSSLGQWEHNSNFSSWVSQTARKPLNLADNENNSDYDILEGFNRHTISRFGWSQEEENWKLKLTDEGSLIEKDPYISKELGVARYRAIIDYDFSESDKYMATAGLFWDAVREEWRDVLLQHPDLSLRKTVDNKPLFSQLFDFANDVYVSGNYDDVRSRSFAKETIHKYLK